jgi:gas vesicle protein
MTGENRISYLFLGLGLGTAAGMLLARKPGVETRNDIERKVREGRDLIKQRGQELLDNATETVARGKQTVRNQMKSLSDAVAAGKLAYERNVTAASRSN